MKEFLERTLSHMKESRFRHLYAWLGMTFMLGFCTGILYITIGWRLYSKAPWLFQEWVYREGPVPFTGFLGSAAALVGWCLVIYLGYVIFNRGIPGSRWRKGVVFGFAIWATCVLSMELFDLNTTRVPVSISVFGWMLMFLPVLLATGAVLGWMYPEPESPDPVGKAGGHGAGLRADIREAWEEIKENKGLIIVAIIVSTVFQFIWSFLGFMVITRSQVEKVEWVLRPGMLEGEISAGQVLGFLGAGLYWAAAITICYFVFRRGLKYGSVKSGLLFGAWAALLVVLPLGVFLLPGSRLPADSVLISFTIVPFVMIAGMGFVAGIILSEPVGAPDLYPPEEEEQ